VADDFSREAMILVAVGGWCVHVMSIAHPTGARQVAQQVDKATDPAPPPGVPMIQQLPNIRPSNPHLSAKRSIG
jgi:hypothetical protein